MFALMFAQEAKRPKFVMTDACSEGFGSGTIGYAGF
jgi:hypothetical protein